MDDDSVTRRLRELAEQRRTGAISEAEFAAAKRTLLGEPAADRFAPETLSLPAVFPDAPPPGSEEAPSAGAGERPVRGLVLLLAAVGVALVLLAAVVWMLPRLG